MKNLILFIAFLQFNFSYQILVQNKLTVSSSKDIKNFVQNDPDSLIVYSEYDVTYSPSWEIGNRIPNGDGLSIQENNRDFPHSGKTCIKIGYLTRLNQFVGINWLPYNLQTASSGINLHNLLTGDISMSFWAKGAKGDEKIKCQVGGNNNSGDSIEFPKGTQSQWISLTQDWEQYEINLSKEDLSNVVTIFSIYLSKDKNWGKDTIHVYLDDIVLKCRQRQ